MKKSSYGDFIQIPAARKFCAYYLPPGSKSITNRALVLAALSQGTSILEGVLVSEDTLVMVDALRLLGFQVNLDHSAKRITISGNKGMIPTHHGQLQVKNSGTSLRFLLAMVALGSGTFEFLCSEAMAARPIASLSRALEGLGLQTTVKDQNGYPPLIIKSQGLNGGTIQLDGGISSQYLSALLMVLPLCQQDSEITISGELVSRSYVRMTMQMIEQFGGKVFSDQNFQHFKIPGGQCYSAVNYKIEPDASAASYFFAAAALSGSAITVLGLNQESMQSDIKFVDALQRMGCGVRYGCLENDELPVQYIGKQYQSLNGKINTTFLQGHALKAITVDMNDFSDTAQTLAAVACFASGTTIVKNIAHNRYKETDRITHLLAELGKIGVKTVENNSGFAICSQPPDLSCQGTLKTYNDHRMAMSFALLGMNMPNIKIENPDCVQKTYPEFFTDFLQLIS